jgi:hypothetical protein
VQAAFHHPQIDISEVEEDNEKVIESKRVHEEYKEDKGVIITCLFF